MNRPPTHHASGRVHGLTLVELLLAVALGTVLILGLVQIAAATSAASALQRNLAQLQDRARFARGYLAAAIRQAGYRPEPWNEAFELEALDNASRDGFTPAGDRVAIRSWSNLNCFDNRNPVEDAEGQPVFFLRESEFRVNADRNLVLTCRYGPGPDELVVQVNQGIVPGVESFQVLYGDDADRDAQIDRWVPAGAWSDPRNVLGARLGLLLASDEPVAQPEAAAFSVLGRTQTAPADGRLRGVFEFALAIRGRSG